MPNKTTWVIVADNTQAKIFRIVKFPKIEEVATLAHPEGRLRNQDLVSSEPGRTFQSVGTERSAYQSATSPKQNESIKFAAHLAKHLTTAHQKGEFSALYVFAAPTFLGILRKEMDPQTQKAVVGEIDKDMTTRPITDIQQHLSDL